MTIERRYIPATELRVVEQDGTRKLKGHAAVFGALSEELGGFREKIARGTFAETIKSDDIRALFNHNPDNVLGRNTANTLALREDPDGLMMEVNMADDDMSRRVLSYIQRGDVSQQSFSFVTLDDAWEVKDGENIRTLKRVQLFDVGPVTFPAYSQTDIAARSLSGLGVDHARFLSALVRKERGLPALAE